LVFLSFNFESQGFVCSRAAMSQLVYRKYIELLLAKNTVFMILLLVKNVICN